MKGDKDFVYEEFMPSALDRQVGGDHYKDMQIQPMFFSWVNRLNPLQAGVVKYVCRYKKKGGRLDLEKAKHLIDMLIEFEYDQEIYEYNQEDDDE